MNTPEKERAKLREMLIDECEKISALRKMNAELIAACQEMLNLIDTNLVFPPPEGWETLAWEEKLQHPRSQIYDKMQMAITKTAGEGGGVK